MGLAIGDPLRAAALPNPLSVEESSRPIVEPTSSSPIEAALGYVFHDRRLLVEALTHASAAHKPTSRRQRRRSNERLEFLGDRVLGVMVAHMLIEQFRADPEGSLALRQDALIRKETIANVGRDLGVGSWLVVAKSEEDGGGRKNPAVLADAVEALIGAIFLDGGWQPAEHFVRRHWLPLLTTAALPTRDPKNALQEWAQGRGIERPSYLVVTTEGPPHAPRFEVSVSLPGIPPVVGAGSSKRSAEQAAAAALLEHLDRPAP